MKFKSIASRIIVSVVPIILVTTILFILIIYQITEQQINEQFDRNMEESLSWASLEIRNELTKNADIAKSMALYAETCSISSIENGDLKAFYDEDHTVK